MQKEELLSAAQIAQDQDPELQHFIYCYKDKAVNRFAPIFTNDKEPKFMVDGLRLSVLKGEHVKELVGLVLCFCGTFELKSGTFDLFDEPSAICDCDLLIEKLGGSTDGKVC